MSGVIIPRASLILLSVLLSVFTANSAVGLDPVDYLWHKKARVNAGFLLRQKDYPAFGPAAMMAADTSNFLMFSWNKAASLLACSS
ncbi:MAG: hypothetical protein RLZZ602_1786 [Pseudomonadota bacterium]